MQLNYILSKELAGKMILAHPPEPRKELLLSPPGDGIYLGKPAFSNPVFWDFRKLINPHISIVGITGSEKVIFGQVIPNPRLSCGIPMQLFLTGLANTSNG